MHPDLKLEEKYERNGWPSLARPDLKPPEGWSLSLITAHNRIRNHRLSPDGQTIAFIWDREELSDVYTIPTTGGWPSRVSTNRGLVAYWSDEIPQWSPDSNWLAFGVEGHVHIVPRAGGVPKKITSFAPAGFSPVWMPDSQRLIVSVERDDAIQLLLTDRDGCWPRALVTDPRGDVFDARPSPDGKQFAYVWRPFDDLNRLDVRIVDVATGNSRELVGTPKIRAWSPRWSPDGSVIAFLTEQPDFNEIWLIRPDGTGLRQLTHLGHDAGDLAWSPDGARIACSVNRNGSFDLALIDAQSGEPTFLRPSGGFHARPNWSPDGKALTFEYESPIQPPDLYRLDVDTRTVTQLTFSNLPALAWNALVTPEMVSYKSFDGLEIPAFLYRPAKPNGAAILHPHGGPSSQYVMDWDILAQYFLAKGYTWIAPNYRGSTGYGFKFEHGNYDDWGKGDMQDCLHGANYLRTLPGIDPERLAIYGGSYGGYMTALCLSRDPEYRFACGVSKYGDSNLYSSWAQCNRDLRLYTEIFLGHPAKNRQKYIDGSPLYQVENVQKPVLILHGLDDDVVPPEASEEWVDALRKAGKTFEYKTYAGEPHGFLMRKTQLDAFGRMERFLDWYLQVQ
ncbi:MAG TPA: S9 family peptidase [Anaerolineales bacterium]|nr:S9 family peptidase [Anaerolineales bacterium]